MFLNEGCYIFIFIPFSSQSVLQLVHAASTPYGLKYNSLLPLFQKHPAGYWFPPTNLLDPELVTSHPLYSELVSTKRVAAVLHVPLSVINP